jgi:hypothetical protein
MILDLLMLALVLVAGAGAVAYARGCNRLIETDRQMAK